MKKDKSQIILKVLIVLLVLELLFIPLLVIAEVKKVLPIVFFLIMPTLFSIFIVLLSRNCMNSYLRKKKKILEKLSV